MDATRDPLRDVREHLRREPVFLEVFDRLIRALTARDDVAIGASGSLALGNVDEWSDLDLEVVGRPGVELEELTDWTVSAVRGVAPLLAHFPASHIGLDQIFVFFFLVGDTLVKADVFVAELDEFLDLKETRVLVDPGGFVAAARERREAGEGSSDDPDFDDLHQKFTGWIWYTYSKIARGELFEALDSLGVMRAKALLPFLQLVSGLPFEGSRRLEQRLSPERLRALDETVPRGLAPAELYRALMRMADLFAELQPAAAERLGRDHRGARLEEMRRHVQEVHRRALAR